MDEESAVEPEELRVLKEKSQRAVDSGRYEEAESYIQQAHAWACQHGDARQRDSTVCQRAAIAIQLGRGEKELPPLREILVRSKDLASARLAAYHISLHYELTKNYKKSLFYARIALDRARALGREEWVAISHNQLGNALLGQGAVDSARAEYEKAFALTSAEPTVRRAAILHNLGYCNILNESFTEGYRMLYESLRIFRRFEVEGPQVPPRLDLCFAHLETGRYRLALLQGARALRLAEKSGHQEGIKNALYLLGEAAQLSGDSDTAHEYFDRLREEFYPQASYLPAFLLSVDVRKLINLHA